MRVKKYQLSGFLLSVVLMASCSGPKVSGYLDVKPVMLSGDISGVADTTLIFTYTPFELLGVSHELPVEIDSLGHFSLTFTSAVPVKGFFSFGKIPKTYEFSFITTEGRDSNMSVPSVDFRMLWCWLEPGDEAMVEVDAAHIAETFHFTGEGADNNTFVNLEELTFNDYRHKYLGNYYNLTFCSPDMYRQRIDELRSEQLGFLEKFQAEHTLSDHLVKVYHSDYITGAVSALIHYPDGNASFNGGKRVVLPDDYWDFMDDVEPDTEAGDKGLGYFYFLKSYLNQKFKLSGEILPEGSDFYDYVKSQLPEKTAYQYMAWALARDFNTRLYSEFGENCPYPDIALQVKESYQHMEGMLEGSAAPAVAFTDVNGDTISLEQFRGSWLYIDFWATWCKPCIAEIPALEEIQQKYSQSNLRFVSVSFDRETDHQKWLDFVKDHNLKGVQVIAGSECHDKLDSAWNIDLIPRFVLLDPDGKMAKANAPRPSDPRLISLLDENLKE